ncbi:uncharacterized protein MELLADRAFT_109070 [Melampsora larici-populina 98AG31]|uniref:Uncharacterized protein n=1 Tax=Melampsora larici-populina (strain 98AG31 / pathotype 3-4-7) TaxID=747676 RepID=F4RV83_MELLP|nr:uncharacterized protein MELLADRAFT_109070 [Melampsora larici-populina 98AG31]EGG03576.1 hypothetical protein MELLADRAFT_109070 [Melampsora larici-populina 98AG31]
MEFGYQLVRFLAKMIVVIHLNSAVIPSKQSSRLVRRFIDGVKTAEELTFDTHITNIVQDPLRQLDFRQWVTSNRPTQNGVKIEDNGLYAERNFLDHLYAWHKADKGYLLSDQVAKLLEQYPLSSGAKVGHIPETSYLRTTLMTPGDFIQRYLPPNDEYRNRFWAGIRHEFSGSSTYLASDIFHRYETFALNEIRTQVLWQPRNSLPLKTYMTEYLKWAKEYNVDTEEFFRLGKGEYRLKDPFIKYLYKKAKKLNYSRREAYFTGDIQSEFNNFLRERNNVSFAKKILYKFQEWKYNVGLGWTAFRKQVFNFRWKYVCTFFLLFMVKMFDGNGILFCNTSLPSEKDHP